MTEEEGKSDNVQSRIWNLSKKTLPLRILLNITLSFFVKPLSLRQKKEKEIMTNNEETRQESTQSQTQMIMPTEPLPPAQQAITDFKEITEALAGSNPEWCLPRPDFKAIESDPKIDRQLVSTSCFLEPPTT
jgi:hypothetical protein